MPPALRRLGQQTPRRFGAQTPSPRRTHGPRGHRQLAHSRPVRPSSLHRRAALAPFAVAARGGASRVPNDRSPKPPASLVGTCARRGACQSCHPLRRERAPGRVGKRSTRGRLGSSPRPERPGRAGATSAVPLAMPPHAHHRQTCGVLALLRPLQLCQPRPRSSPSTSAPEAAAAMTRARETALLRESFPSARSCRRVPRGGALLLRGNPNHKLCRPRHAGSLQTALSL